MDRALGCVQAEPLLQVLHVLRELLELRELYTELASQEQQRLLTGVWGCRCRPVEGWEGGFDVDISSRRNYTEFVLLVACEAVTAASPLLTWQTL